ncbi:hypothetical protein ACLOJK_022992 [Asimina triloba]
MPPKKGPRTIPSSEITGALSVPPHQEETGLPSPPPQQLPEEMTDVVPVVPLTGPVGTITFDAESPVTRVEFNALTDLLRTLQQQLSHSRQQQPTSHALSDTLSSEPSIMPTPSSPAEPLVTTSAPVLSGDYPQTWGAPPYIHIGEGNTVMSDPTNDVVALCRLPASCQAPNRSSTLSLYLHSQPIPEKFEILGMPVFGPTLDPTGHVINYNIHMDLRTASEGVMCKVFSATLDEQGKMWFASLASGSITSFR